VEVADAVAYQNQHVEVTDAGLDAEVQHVEVADAVAYQDQHLEMDGGRDYERQDEDEDESQGHLEVYAEREERMLRTPSLRSSPASIIRTSGSPCAQNRATGYKVGKLKKYYVDLAESALKNEKWPGQYMDEINFYPSYVRSDKAIKDFKTKAMNGLKDLDRVRKGRGEGKEAMHYIESTMLIIGCSVRAGALARR